MRKNKLAFDLIEMGLKAETIANLTESQLKLLYRKLNEGKKEPKEATITTTYGKGEEVSAEKVGQIIGDPKNKISQTPGGGFTTSKEETTEAKKKKKSKKYNPWAICTTSVGRKDKKKYERCVMDVKESIKEGKDPIDLFLENKILSLLETQLPPRITKREFLQMISENKTAPAKPKEKQKGKERKGPFDVPKVKPGPKAKTETNEGETETAEPTTKPKTPRTKPKTPFSPKPGAKPAPKAGKKSVPTWLKWDNIGLNF